MCAASTHVGPASCFRHSRGDGEAIAEAKDEKAATPSAEGHGNGRWSTRPTNKVKRKCKQQSWPGPVGGAGPAVQPQLFS